MLYGERLEFDGFKRYSSATPFGVTPLRGKLNTDEYKKKYTEGAANAVEYWLAACCALR
jgi:hypothetical protein